MTEAEALSEKLLPSNANTTINQDWAAERYRPAVAQALQSKDDRIKELEGIMREVADIILGDYPATADRLRAAAGEQTKEPT